MDDRYFERFKGLIIDPTKPPRKQLWRLFQEELAALEPNERESRRVESSFNIGFHGHERSPVRASGEAYFFHPLRSAFCAVWRQVRLGLCNFDVIVYLFPHDCIEDAKKSRRRPSSLANKIRGGLGKKYVGGTLTLTKLEGEEAETYFPRMLRTSVWTVLWAKFEERDDNIRTLEGVPDDKAKLKILETEMWFPKLRERMQVLIQVEVDQGALPAAYLKLPDDLWDDLKGSLKAQRRRLNFT